MRSHQPEAWLLGVAQARIRLTRPCFHRVPGRRGGGTERPHAWWRPRPSYSYFCCCRSSGRTARRSRPGMPPPWQASPGWCASLPSLNARERSPCNLPAGQQMSHGDIRGVRSDVTSAPFTLREMRSLRLQGFATALMANTQLMGYFIDKGERSAATIQGIGVVSNYAVLFQVRPLRPRACAVPAVSGGVPHSLRLYPLPRRPGPIDAVVTQHCCQQQPSTDGTALADGERCAAAGPAGALAGGVRRTHDAHGRGAPVCTPKGVVTKGVARLAGPHGDRWHRGRAAGPSGHLLRHSELVACGGLCCPRCACPPCTACLGCMCSADLSTPGLPNDVHERNPLVVSGGAFD